MVEESPESFINRWRHQAAEVELFAHTEGSPMLEGSAGGVIMQLFERTGPYLSRPGPARVIVNPVIDSLTVVEGDQRTEPPHVESLGVSQLRVTGEVTERDGRVLVVAAGMPVVVSSLTELPPEAAVGATVSVTSLAPVHAFVVTGNGGGAVRHAATNHRRSEAHDELL